MGTRRDAGEDHRAIHGYRLRLAAIQAGVVAVQVEVAAGAGDGQAHGTGGGTWRRLAGDGQEQGDDRRGGQLRAHGTPLGSHPNRGRGVGYRPGDRGVKSRRRRSPLRCAGAGCVWRSWRRPTLPRPRDRSTIGADRLNDRVRDGNGCGPVALVASKVKDECVLSWWWAITPSFG